MTHYEHLLTKPLDEPIRPIGGSVSSNEESQIHALERSIERVPWKLLQPQALKDMYILVSSDLDLVQTAYEVVSDNADLIKSWIETRKLSKPTRDQIYDWSQSPDKTFRTLIAHPYVLIQESLDH